MVDGASRRPSWGLASRRAGRGGAARTFTSDSRQPPPRAANRLTYPQAVVGFPQPDQRDHAKSKAAGLAQGMQTPLLILLRLLSVREHAGAASCAEMGPKE